MTSSLVGSEMCIRDRPRHALMLEPPGDGCTALQLQWVWGWHQGVGAVSYTHLTLPTIGSV
eukprot:7444910-Prorocentrum_lima.AAC.1